MLSPAEYEPLVNCGPEKNRYSQIPSSVLLQPQPMRASVPVSDSLEYLVVSLGISSDDTGFSFCGRWTVGPEFYPTIPSYMPPRGLTVRTLSWERPVLRYPEITALFTPLPVMLSNHLPIFLSTSSLRAWDTHLPALLMHPSSSMAHILRLIVQITRCGVWMLPVCPLSRTQGTRSCGAILTLSSRFGTTPMLVLLMLGVTPRQLPIWPAKQVLW